MKKFSLLSLLLPLAAIFFVLASCVDQFNFNEGHEKDLEPLGENQFYAQNMINEKYYVVTAEKICEGETCVIWAELGSGVSQALAEEIAAEYDQHIRPNTIEVFSKKDIKKEGNHFDDILDYASWLVGGDGKLTILLLDIQDGFNTQGNESYVAGYFFAGNFFEKGPIKNSVTGKTMYYSNARDMIYIGVNPGLHPDLLEQTYSTFAHELQHLINFTTSIWLGRKNLMDTWVDEGLSSQAEYFYLGKNPAKKCEWFSEDINGTIAKGNNFFVWDNYKSEPLAILDEYATVYLFFRWLYLQANERALFFLDIETSQHYDYEAVTSVMGSNWETLLGRWFAANYAPDDDDYGYIGDDYLQGVITVNPIAGSSVVLYPGEGVYSVISGSFSRSSAGFIRYAGIADNSSTINTSSPYNKGVLITFNANTSNKGSRETGYLTGVSPSIARSIDGETQTRQFTGPYVLDARDVLGRNREKDISNTYRMLNAIKAEK